MKVMMEQIVMMKFRDFDPFETESDESNDINYTII